MSKFRRCAAPMPGRPRITRPLSLGLTLALPAALLGLLGAAPARAAVRGGHGLRPFTARPLTTGATYYVDPVNGSDSTGNGSQAAPFQTIGNTLNAASNDSTQGAGDTILLADGTYNESGLEIEGTPITIKSLNGPANCIISGGNNGILEIDYASTHTVIQGIRFQDGGAESGGAIAIDDGSPTIAGCVFQGSDAEYGGAVEADSGGSPTLTGCTFLENEAADGGAVGLFYGSGATITGCTFQDNESGTGGAIYVGQDSKYGLPVVTLTGCTFVGNFLTGDVVQQDGPVGGALFAGQGYTVDAVNCAFSQNFALVGGGISADNALLSLTNCTFDDNIAPFDAGAVYAENDSLVTLANDILWNDWAESGLPELDDDGTVAEFVSDNDIDDPDLTGGTAGAPDSYGDFLAAPLFVSDSDSDLRLLPGSPAFGAGAPGQGAPTRDLNGNVRAATPALGAYESPIDFVAATGSDNSGTGASDAPFGTIGKALSLAGPTDVVAVGDGTYAESGLSTAGKAVALVGLDGAGKAVIDGGGANSVFAITGGEGPQTLIKGFTIQNGSSATGGGGMAIENSSPTVVQCVLRNNAGSAASGGGGAYLLNSASVFESSVFTGNSSAGPGGGLSAVSGSPAVYGCTFTGNTGAGGGAVSFSVPARPFIRRPAGILLNLNNLGQISLQSSILWGDTDTTDAAPELLVTGGTDTLNDDDIAQSSVTTGTAKQHDPSGDFDAGPRFAVPYSSKSPASTDLRLLPSSPCAGQGASEFGPFSGGIGSYDAAGAARPDPPSIGAYEVLPPPAAPTTLNATSNGTSQNVLTWTASATPGVTAYDIYRSTTQGSELVATVPTGLADKGALTYTDSKPDYGQTDYYAVRANLDTVLSAPSNEASTAATLVVPPAPTALTARPASALVKLSWKAPAGPVTGYNVFRSASSGQEDPSTATPLNGAAPVTALTYTDSTAQNGTTYYYEVVAANGAGSGNASNEASGAPEAAPTTPQVTATTGNALVTLTWPSAGTAVTYIVKRAASQAGPYAVISSPITGSGTTFAFKDYAAVNGQTSWYTVTAVNVGGAATSAEVSAAPALAAPTLTTVKSAGTPKAPAVKIGWNAPAGKVTSYTLYRSVIAPGQSPTAFTSYQTGLTKTLFTDTNVTHGTTYAYEVTATNGQESARSGSLSATP